MPEPNTPLSTKARATIVENLQDGIILLDQENIITDLNPAAVKFLEHAFEAAIGKPAQAILPFWDALSKTSQNQSYTFEYEIPDEQKYHEVIVTPLQGQSQEAIGKLITLRDISAQKITAEMLTHRSNELEIANQEVEEFAYSAAHDLRTPLRAMEGFSQILLDDYAHLLDSEGQELLQRIQTASQHMALLIDDLLLLSKITRKELNIETVNLSALASQTLADLQNRYPHRKIETKITPNLNVVGDPHLLKIAIQNLLDNAWKFTRNRPLAIIELGYTEIDSAPTYFVRDNGIGFEMAYTAKLFKPFQRLHSPGQFDGTGIGLATVDRIIRRHRGRIWAESKEDQGATFYFIL